jgi:type I restriction-modification system DNA methylase subunit
MTAATAKDWQKEFGIELAGPKVFFSTKLDLDAPGTNASQGHVLRRAFDLLKLDGILCTENVPLVYFKEVKQIEPAEVARLHRTFWNHGGAPILVLIAQDEVHVYSGLIRPAAQSDNGGAVPGLVETLNRTSAAIREFLPTVESGEFFRRHHTSFNPEHRVDRDLLDNLQATRDKLLATSNGALEPRVLNALFCRLVFACYLFDREIVGQTYLESIGLRNASHLRDVLALQPKTKAKKYLYDLFKQLGNDFNGDLFSDNLDVEAEMVSPSFIDPLDDFFRATDVLTGQSSFWPYDFAAIPVEAISAIYERFLQGSDKSEGAFYTPRFLAEVVLDMALATMPSLLGRRYLDPACGSGIFLVGLFNRIAEEWKQSNPEARNDRRARELRKILCTNLYGVDINPTACRITAFSLYLAYLDQLAPRDIQELQQKGHKLPKLVHYPDNLGTEVEGNIWCGDFFVKDSEYPVDADLVIGNPPWGSVALKNTSAAKWCAHSDHLYPIPDKQIAAAFIWKASHHVGDSGRICLVLPYSTLFNHSRTALDFQRTLFKCHAVDHVLNLVDYRFFLFAEALHPAIVMAYRKKAPENSTHSIEYWAPKADGLVMQAEIITIPPEDRSRVSVGEVLCDLEGKDAPQVWKRRFWATTRDRRLVDRLSIYPRLRDHVRQLKEKETDKPWLISVGVQPVRKGDDPAKAETIGLPSKLLIEATSSDKIDLFLLPSDCTELPAAEFTVRNGSNKDTAVFKSPHVLVSKGFTRVAFASFDVAFQDFLRGIHGPTKDRDLLIFLTAYLRSRLARYFLFHTASNWGVARQQVHVDELLRLPFPLPEALPDSGRSWEIVKEVGQIVGVATSRSKEDPANRQQLVRIANESIEPLLDAYFDILPQERMLIDDTVEVIIPSSLPTRARRVIPTIRPSTQVQQQSYATLLCDTLNSWSQSGPFIVQGCAMASTTLGIGIAILQKTLVGASAFEHPEDFADLLTALERLRKVTSRKLNMFELVRGAKVFDRDRLYLVKPIGQRFWTQTAALNDADEIASTILMYSPQEVA